MKVGTSLTSTKWQFADGTTSIFCIVDDIENIEGLGRSMLRPSNTPMSSSSAELKVVTGRRLMNSCVVTTTGSMPYADASPATTLMPRTAARRH